MDIGSRIKHARKARGFTQKSLAQEIGAATGTIQQYELGKRQPRLEQLQAIADALDMDLMELLGYETTEKSLEAVEEIISKYQAICSTVIDDKRVPNDLKSAIRDELPIEPMAALSALAFNAGADIGHARAAQDVFDPAVFQIGQLFGELNEEGIQKAIERVDELTEIPKYQRTDTPENE